MSSVPGRRLSPKKRVLAEHLLRWRFCAGVHADRHRHPQRVAALSRGHLAAAGEVLDLCAPVGAAAPRPGVLLIHGGTWTSGDKSAYTTTCALLATRGFVAATLNYHLAPTYHWPAQLVDVQLPKFRAKGRGSDVIADQI